MTRYPVEIARCQHIKTSGAQCGSPALKEKDFCYYHEENRTVPAEVYLDGESYADRQIMLPPLEDAHAIQTMLRHVMQMMMQRRIDRKDAGLMLYALQIASGNMKQMEAEKPGPTRMVREPEKVGETPMGMTPWSASGEGHDVEDGEEDEEYEEDDVEDEEEEAEPRAPRKTKYEERIEEQTRMRRVRDSAVQLAEISAFLRENPKSTYEELRAKVEGCVMDWRQSIGLPRDIGAGCGD